MSVRLILLLLYICCFNYMYSQASYSKDEINMKFALEEERIKSHLDAIEYANKAIDAKLAAQDKQIENLKYVFVILLSLIGIAVALGGFFINRRNQERLAELQTDLKSAKDDALQELTRIKEIANLEVRMAKAELKEIIFEQQSINRKDQLKE